MQGPRPGSRLHRVPSPRGRHGDGVAARLATARGAGGLGLSDRLDLSGVRRQVPRNPPRRPPPPVRFPRSGIAGCRINEITLATELVKPPSKPTNNQPRPEAVVLGRPPPRGGRFREVAPVGGIGVGKAATTVCTSVLVPEARATPAQRKRFPWGLSALLECTPDRLKLFRSHSQRPWV